MEQPIAPAPRPSYPLAARARTFQHDALAQLFEASFDDVYEYAHALTADHDTAADVVETAYRHLLDRLGELPADGKAMTAGVLALAEAAIRHVDHSRFRGQGIREAIARLPAAEHEAVTLRLVAGLDHGLIALATARRPSSVLGSETAALRALRGAGGGMNFATPATQRDLDAALDRLLDGESASRAAARVSNFPDAPELLAAAANLVALPAQPAPPAVRARVRNHFLAAAEERRAQWVHRHHVPAVVPGHRPRPHGSPVSATVALVLAALLAVMAGAVLAFAANFSTPSSAIYPLKRADENFLLALTFDRVAKANLEVKLSEERTREAETEAATRHGANAVDAMSTRYDLLRAAATDLAAIRHHDAGWKKVRDSYLEQASLPVDPLERLLATNDMAPDAQSISSLNQAFQNDRKKLDAPLGTATPAPAPPSGAPNATPPPSQ